MKRTIADERPDESTDCKRRHTSSTEEYVSLRHLQRAGSRERSYAIWAVPGARGVAEYPHNDDATRSNVDTLGHPIRPRLSRARPIPDISNTLVWEYEIPQGLTTVFLVDTAVLRCFGKLFN